MQSIRSLEDIAQGLEALAVLDAALLPVIAKAGPLPLRLQPGGFDGLASIIVAQMVSRQSADAIWKRLTGLFDSPMTPAQFLKLPESDLRGAGLSGPKIRTLVAAARALEQQALDLDRLPTLSGAEALQKLTDIKGIGPWTAQVYLMFCCGHADLFPSGDVALQASVSHALDFSNRIDAKALALHAERWSPWRSVAARLFWAYYAHHMGRSGQPVA